MVYQCINIRQVPREVLKTEASFSPDPLGGVENQVPWEMLKTEAGGLDFNTSLGTWRILMHEKPCLTPILKRRFIVASLL